MALPDYKINAFSKPVSALGDTPQMSAAELKEWFDSNSTNELKNSVNGIIDETVAELSGKVDKTEGKALSTNDYTNEEKQKVALAVTQDELEAAIADLINGAPEALDTLKELGDALVLHEDAYDALLEMVGNKANKTELDAYATKEEVGNINEALDETAAELSGKVDKTEGKALSTNDYTNEEKQKVALAVTQGELEGAIADLINGAPEALDTLKELGDALALHEDAYDALLEMVGNKANKTELATYATKEESNNILPKVNYNDLNTFQGNVAIVIREDTSKIYLFLQECASSLSGSPDSNGNGGIEDGGDEWEEIGSEEYRQFLISTEGQIFIRTSPNHTDWTTWVEKQGQSIDTSSFATKTELDAYATKVDELAKKIGGVANIAVESWEDVQRIVRMGLASNLFAIGDQLACKRGETTLVWDIIGIDHDTPTDKNFKHSLTLQLHNCLLSLQHDGAEALFYAENELLAGTYNFTLLAGYDTTHGGGKIYSFTLANPVPAGGVIMFPWDYKKQAADTKISTYGSVTSTVVIESVAVTEGANGTALESIGECNHTHRIRGGSNNWMQSAMRQYLNSDAPAGGIWTPKTNFDRPPYWASTTAGFLNGLDADFLAVIGEVDKITVLNTLTDGGGRETNAEKFFLLSRSEVYGGKENGILEGDAYPYYSEPSDLSVASTRADTNRIKYSNGKARIWWLRSPRTFGSNIVCHVGTTGVIDSSAAVYSCGVAPACCIV